MSTPFITIDENDAARTPIFRQIYTAIRTGVLDGRFSSGSRVPSTRTLAMDLGVSRMTVVNAYDQLFAEGYLEGRHGSGTFVATQLPEEFLRADGPNISSAGTETKRRVIRFSREGKALSKRMATIARHHGATSAVPFQHSLMAADEFPFDIWAKIVQRQLKCFSRKLGGYQDAAGYAPLRSAVAEHLRSTRGVRCEDEQVIITAGTQQAVSLISRVLLSTDDTVWIEDPCHLGARDIFDVVGAKVVGVPVDPEGFDLSAATRARSSTAKMIYVTPSRQFPMGITMSLQRRLNLLNWASENDTWIIEDDYDSEFRYTGRPLPALQGLDNDGRVLYVGTFSKTVFPGLRLGCIVSPPDLGDVLTAAKSLADLHCPLTDQMALAEFISEGHFERHVRRMRTLYGERQENLLNAVEKYIGDRLDIEPSPAGMHLIGWLPKGVDDVEVSERAAKAGVLAGPLSRYAIMRQKRGGLLLGYTAFNKREITEGANKLETVL